MKRKWIPEPEEFFVGYLPETPKQTSSFLRQIIIGIGVAVVAIAILLSKSQREFSSANFEYGTFTTVEGFLFSNPVPHIKIQNGIDSFGNAHYQSVLLVGEGKAGAEKTIKEFESRLGKLEGAFVKLQGQLIHGHQKSLLQLSPDKFPKRAEHNGTNRPSSLMEIGSATISGEIVDPKCYFGVMKPGEGKPHRSCAVRCIAGGIPPIFHVNGMSEYYLLLDENLQPVNQRILNIVGDNIVLNGKAYQFDNWKILLLNNNYLKEQAQDARLLWNMMAMEDGITMCKN